MGSNITKRVAKSSEHRPDRVQSETTVGTAGARYNQQWALRDPGSVGDDGGIEQSRRAAESSKHGPDRVQSETTVGTAGARYNQHWAMRDPGSVGDYGGIE